MPFSYATVPTVRDILNLSDTSKDSLVLMYLEQSSEFINQYCNRFFFTKEETLTFDCVESNSLAIPDLLEVLEVTLDGNPLDSDSYFLTPRNVFPKRRLTLLEDSGEEISIEGVWGYGDGSSLPWKALAPTVSVEDDSSTLLEVSASTGLEAGQTLRLSETEQTYVLSITEGEEEESSTLSVIRGINGSTPTSHATGSIEVALYPKMITNAAITSTIEMFKRTPKSGAVSESIGSYSVSFSNWENINGFYLRALGHFVKVPV